MLDKKNISDRLLKCFSSVVHDIMRDKGLTNFVLDPSIKSNLQQNKILNYSDIFSMNRTNDLDLPETGFSIGHGINYGLKRKKEDNTILFSTKTGIGQVLRTSRQDNMPNKSSLNNKSSDFAGFLKLDLFGF